MRDAASGERIPGAQVQVRYSTELSATNRNSTSPLEEVPIDVDLACPVLHIDPTCEQPLALIASHESYRTKTVLWQKKVKTTSSNPKVPIEIALQPMIELHVQVRDRQGKPIEGATAYAYSVLASRFDKFSASIAHPDQISIATTDHSGKATLTLRTDLDQVQIRCEHSYYDLYETTLTVPVSTSEGQQTKASLPLNIQLLEYWIAAIYLPEVRDKELTCFLNAARSPDVLRHLQSWGIDIHESFRGTVQEKTKDLQSRSGRLVYIPLIPNQFWKPSAIDPSTPSVLMNFFLSVGAPCFANIQELKIPVVPLSDFSEASIPNVYLEKPCPKGETQIILELAAPADTAAQPPPSDQEIMRIRDPETDLRIEFYQEWRGKISFGADNTCTVRVPVGRTLLLEAGDYDWNVVRVLKKCSPKPGEDLNVPIPLPQMTTVDVRVTDQFGRPVCWGNIVLKAKDSRNYSFKREFSIQGPSTPIHFSAERPQILKIEGCAGMQEFSMDILPKQLRQAKHLKRPLINITLKRKDNE